MIRLRRAVPLVGLLVAAAGAARADDRSWALCTPGALRSCHSVSVHTAAVYSGGIRVGTTVVISLANLQGSGLSGTSTTPSGLYQVVISGPLGGTLPTTVANQAAALTGGATGSLTMRRVVTTVQIGGNLAWIELLGSTPAGAMLLGGCTGTATVFGPTTAHTCGPHARAVFTFTTTGIVDAAQFTNVTILAGAPSGSATCHADPSATPFFGPRCDAIPDPTVVPEPTTIVLLGTGLFGTGAAAWRRRRRRP